MRVYKPSGIEWLGEIPQSWEIKPLQAIFNQRNEQNNNLEFQTILSLVKDVGVIPYEEKGNVGNKAKDDLQGYKIARVNDLVLNKMNAVIGSLGVSKYDGLVSPIYLVLYIENPNYLIAYYSYLFQTKSIQKFLRKFAYGIMEIRESIDYLEFKKMFLPTPPLQEQKEIAEFLDSKCEKIQNYIDKKQKLITLLQEKKTSPN
ncbi:restriction endonuclease subunit S [Campylobacter felis]|uniref:restriction endonuclease subunit S n=1 Tax=Campylobacter felis TaxID=2974565 RepID=UPI00255EC5D7|nr:restriction endonuclease subunit S [Campylobacter felis]MDL0109187.1 restriction endonuclease subunit S [Campylobacter felis]